MENGLNTHLLNTILLNSEIKQEIQKTDAYLSFAKFQNQTIAWKIQFDPSSKLETELYRTLVETISDLIMDYIQEELIKLSGHPNLLELIH